MSEQAIFSTPRKTTGRDDARFLDAECYAQEAVAHTMSSPGEQLNLSQIHALIERFPMAASWRRRALRRPPERLRWRAGDDGPPSTGAPASIPCVVEAPEADNCFTLEERVPC